MKTAVGVVGVGRMGVNHARVLAARDDVELHVYDVCGANADAVSRTLDARTHASLESLLDHVEAVIVATPPADHARVVRAGLDARRAVLCEKPLATNLREAADLCRRAGGRLMPGHVERFNPVVRGLRRLLARHPIEAITASRLGMASPRHAGVDVLMDLGVHDLDLVSYLGRSAIVSVASVLAGAQTALVVVRLASGVVARVEVTWNSPRKVREFRAWGNGALFQADLIDGEIQRFTRGLDGDVRGVARRIPVVAGEALEAQLDAFLKALRAGAPMPVAAEVGLEAVRWATLAREGAPGDALMAAVAG